MKSLFRFSPYILSLIVATAGAEETAELETLTVTTATKTEKNIDGVTASITVVTAEEIEKTGAVTLKDVITRLPALITQYGGFPHPSSKSKASISIRGASANGTLILLDGKRIAGQTQKPYELDRIPTAIIERIEVIKGSMSTLYGSDAIGGVINIITKQPAEPVSNVDVKYGQNSDGDAQEKSINLSTMGKKDKLSYKVYGSILNTTPFKVNKKYNQQAVHPQNHVNIDDPINGQGGQLGVTFRDEADVKTIALGLGYDISSKTKAGLDLNYFTDDREGQYIGLHPKPRPDLAPTLQINKLFVQGTPVNSVDDNNRADVSFDFEHSMANDTIIKARAYRSQYKKRNKTTALAFSPAPENRKFSANVTIDGVESTATAFLNDNHILTAGAEYRHEIRDSAAINPDPSSNEFVRKTFDYKSLFLQDEIEISDSLNATIGGRYDDNSQADSKTTGQAGIVKNLDNGVNLRANIAQGYRAPDVAELLVVSPFFRDARRFGSEVIFGPKKTRFDLKPESSLTTELAVSKRTGKFQGELVLFQNKITDKIALVAKNNDSPGKYYTSENLKDVLIQGLEVSSTMEVNNKVDIAFNATLLDSENETSKKQLAFTPEISAAALVSYRLTPKLSSSLSLRHIGEQFADQQNTAKTDSYTTADLSLVYKAIERLEVYGGINNFSDTDIDEELGSTVGQFFYIGIRSDF